MECRDRLAHWLLELVLEPVRALAADADGDSVTVRAARGSRRFNLTIARDDDEYRWSIHEVAPPGKPEPMPLLEDQATEALTDPEYAFWVGWDTIQQQAA